jgi:hypothetical protein
MSSLRQLDDIHFTTAENNISAKLFGGRQAKELYIAKTDSFGFRQTKNAKIHHNNKWAESVQAGRRQIFLLQGKPVYP